MEEIETKKTNKSVVGIVIGLIVLLAAGGLLAISSRKAAKTTQNNIPQVEGESTSSTEGLSGSVKEFVIDGHNFEFEVKEMVANKGDTVKVTFRDTDGTHNLVIDGYNVRTDIIKGGTEDTIEFVADKTGEFEYYCSVGNHKEAGMTGKLIVK